jgi:hypothetical protein
MRYNKQNCRSQDPQQLLQKLYGVFLNGFCINCSQTLNVARSRWIGAASSWPSYAFFSTQNLKCQWTWMLCPSKNWTAFILGDFEVFRWNLENAAKVPEDVQRHQVFSGVWPCLWPRVDHKCVLTSSRGSLGFTGEVSRGDDPGWLRFDQCQQVWLTN